MTLTVYLKQLLPCFISSMLNNASTIIILNNTQNALVIVFVNSIRYFRLKLSYNGQMMRLLYYRCVIFHCSSFILHKTIKFHGLLPWGATLQRHSVSMLL